MIFKKMPSDKKFDFCKKGPLPFTGNGDYPLDMLFRERETATCPGCGTSRELEKFYIAPQKAVGFCDKKGRRRTLYCVHCIMAFYQKFIDEDPEHNKYKAMFRLCSILGYYYSDELAHQIIDVPHTWEDGKPVSQHEPDCLFYIKAVMADPKFAQLSFQYSDNMNLDVVAKMQDGGEIGLDEQAKKSRRQIINVYHYDPFENEPVEERTRLYEDLLTLIDDSFNEDLTKQKAAVILCLSYRNLDRVNATISELMATPESVQQNADVIKKLTEQKAKETSMISSFAKDNGFSERYAASKARGSGTISAMIRDMELQGYDDGFVNRFDIETSEAMRQVADISAESMFKQLSLNDTDFAKIIKEQGKMIREMQYTMQTQEEELRLLKEKHLKEELLVEYERQLKDKGINSEEIAGLLEQELKYSPSSIGNTFYTAEELEKKIDEEE